MSPAFKKSRTYDTTTKNLLRCQAENEPQALKREGDWNLSGMPEVVPFPKRA
jgi:hypothetical protein